MRTLLTTGLHRKQPKINVRWRRWTFATGALILAVAATKARCLSPRTKDDDHIRAYAGGPPVPAFQQLRGDCAVPPQLLAPMPLPCVVCTGAGSTPARPSREWTNRHMVLSPHPSPPLVHPVLIPPPQPPPPDAKMRISSSGTCWLPSRLASGDDGRSRDGVQMVQPRGRWLAMLDFRGGRGRRGPDASTGSR